MKGQLRILKAQFALGMAGRLTQNRFIVNLPIKDLELYEILLPKIDYYQDGNVEVMQDAVKEYFLIRHVMTGLDKYQFQMSFSPIRRNGEHEGLSSTRLDVESP